LLAYALHCGLDILDLCTSNTTFFTLEEFEVQLCELNETRTKEFNKQLKSQQVDCKAK
jgi:hypothetical protein